MPEEVIQSTFTSTALNDLFPLWTEDPSKARPICMARFGTSDQAVDWTQADVNNPVEKNITNVGVSVITGDSTTANVRVAVEVTNSTDPVDPMRGQVLKEMGLFIDDSANPGTDEPVWKMIWVSKLPDMRVPTLEESGITMSFLVTVPIKFDNSDQIHLITDNAQLETRMDNLENAMGEKPSGAGNSTLWQYVQTMNGSGAAKLKANNEEFTALQKYAYQMNRGQDTPSPVERKASYATVQDINSLVGNRPSSFPANGTLSMFADNVNQEICPLIGNQISTGTYTTVVVYRMSPKISSSIEEATDLLFGVSIMSEPQWNFGSAGKYYRIESKSWLSSDPQPIDFSAFTYHSLNIELLGSDTRNFAIQGPWMAQNYLYLPITIHFKTSASFLSPNLFYPIAFPGYGYRYTDVSGHFYLIFYKDGNKIHLAAGCPPDSASLSTVVVSGQLVRQPNPN